MVNAKSVVLSSTKPVSSFLFKNKSMLNSTVSLSPLLVMSAAASLAFSAPAMAQQQNAPVSYTHLTLPTSDLA